MSNVDNPETPQLEPGLKDIMKVDCYLANVAEENRGKTELNTYIVFRGPEGALPKVLLRVDTSALRIGEPSPALAKELEKKITGRALPAPGSAEEVEVEAPAEPAEPADDGDTPSI